MRKPIWVVGLLMVALLGFVMPERVGARRWAAGITQQSHSSNDDTPFITDGIEQRTFGDPVAPGSLVVVAVALLTSSRTLTVVDDSAGGVNTYTVCTDGGTNATTEIGGASEMWFYCSTTTATMQAVTVTTNSAVSTQAYMMMFEVDGQHASTPVEDVATSVGTTTPYTVGPVTTTSAGSLLIGLCFSSTNGDYTTAGGSWTNYYDFGAPTGAGHAIIGDYQDGVGAASTSWSFTSAANEGGPKVLIAIAPAVVGGLRLLSLTGVGAW
jgi:hypothetical protein